MQPDLLPYGQRPEVGGICVLWTHVKFSFFFLFFFLYSDKDDLDTKYSDSVGSAVHALQARLQVSVPHLHSFR